jgi:hypothetical protein
LWEKGILGTGDPKTLLRTIFYVVGLNFALRGGEEHRSLRHGDNSQIQLVTLSSGDTVLRYNQGHAKCNQGGLKDYNKPRKAVDAFPCEDKRRCPVEIYQAYLDHCPKPLNALPGFYLHPLPNPVDNIWYGRMPVGRHKLTDMVKSICELGGFTGYRTNHSLRSTAATRLYDAQMDEQLISEVTGHRSVAVRSYKRTGEAQKRKISSIVQGLGKATSTVTNSEAHRYDYDVSSSKAVCMTININVAK